MKRTSAEKERQLPAMGKIKSVEASQYVQLILQISKTKKGELSQFYLFVIRLEVMKIEV